MNNQLNSKQPLLNKVVVVTGASSGVGRATALELVRQGAKVVLAARREEALEEAAEECRVIGGTVLVVPTDVTDAGAVNTLAASAQHWGHHIDVWVNNAGLLAAGAFDETPVSVHQKVIETNLMGYVHGAHAVLPFFKAQGRGVLINNISVGGWFPTPYAAAYSASKFGLRGFTEALQGELHQFPDIHVCALYPAFLDTPGIQHAANFTGKVLKPAPPVYDPQKVARSIAHLINHPKNADNIGAAAGFLKVAHTFFPGLSRRITAGVIEKYLKVADSTPVTTGNVLAPVEFGTSIHGGWGVPETHTARNVGIAAAVAGLLLWVALKGKE